jgi:hypothetical protein
VKSVSFIDSQAKPYWTSAEKNLDLLVFSVCKNVISLWTAAESREKSFANSNASLMTQNAKARQPAPGRVNDP